MKWVSCSIFLVSLAFSWSAVVRDPSSDWPSDWQWPRKFPRHPPPPFEMPRPYPYPPAPFPWRPSTTPEPPSTKSDSSILLFKLNCNPCLPGWGLISMCNSTSDTVCARCPVGTWSPRTHHYQQCSLCTECKEGSYEEMPCLATRDTQCCSCGNPNANVNDDYIRKCVLEGDATDTDIEIYNWDTIDTKPEGLWGDIVRSDVIKEDLFGSDRSDESDEDLFGSEDIDRPFLWLPKKMKQDFSPEEVDIAMYTEEEEEDPSLYKQEDIHLDDPKIVNDLSEGEPKSNDEKNEENQSDVVRIRLHPIRPLPQVQPAAEDSIQVETERVDLPVENNYPPSYHEYSLSSLVHGGDAQRRKAIVLLVLTSAVVLSTVAFVACYVREYCRRRAAAYSGVMVINLTPEEREIIRNSAIALEATDKPNKSRGGYTQMRNEPAGCVVTNPLEDYLNTVDERNVASEGLIENEVLDQSRTK